MVNIGGNREGQERLGALGFSYAPVVCVGTQCVPGGDLRAIADLVGFAYDPPQMLQPYELLERWVKILDAACRYSRQLPAEALEMKPQDRDRSLGALMFHTLHIGRVFLQAYDEGERRSWDGLMAAPEGDMWSGEQLATYGEETRWRLEEWWHGVGQLDPLDRVIETYQGAKTLHESLERETWHTAQHTRQVMMFLGQLGITPNAPLTEDELSGLPLPVRVWD